MKNTPIEAKEINIQPKTQPQKPLPAQKAFQPLGTIRDYLTVQMAQDDSWNQYR